MPPVSAAWLAANPTQTVSVAAAAAAGATCVGNVCTFPTQGAQRRVLKYDGLLPNLGFTYEVAQRLNIFANYSRGLQVPGTDNLYNSFYFPVGSPNATPRPETTDNFDAGLRYRSGRIMAQGSGLVHPLLGSSWPRPSIPSWNAPSIVTSAPSISTALTATSPSRRCRS